MAVTSILLDTNAYAAFKRGDTGALEIIRRVVVVGLNSVVLGELMSGFAVGIRREENWRELDQFLASPRVIVLPVTEQTAEHYATVYKQLRQKGRPIPTNDMWIAASALQHDLAVFSYDRHFVEVAGINVVASIADLRQAS